MNKADPVFNYSKPVPGPDLAKRAGFNRVRFRVPGRASVRWGILPQIPHRGINPQAPLKKKL